MIVFLNLANRLIVWIQACSKVKVCVYVCVYINIYTLYTFIYLFIYLFIFVLSLSRSHEPYLREHTRCSTVKVCSINTHTHARTTLFRVITQRVVVISLPSKEIYRTKNFYFNSQIGDGLRHEDADISVSPATPYNHPPLSPCTCTRHRTLRPPFPHDASLACQLRYPNSCFL
jgi:hypothetical protein